MVSDVGFTPDGEWLAWSMYDPTSAAYATAYAETRMGLGHWVQCAKRLAGRELTKAERATYLAGLGR